MNEEAVEPDFYTIQQFADILRVHANTIRRSIASGRIEAIRVNSGKKRLYRIPKTEIGRMRLFDLEVIIEKIIEKREKEKGE